MACGGCGGTSNGSSGCDGCGGDGMPPAVVRDVDRKGYCGQVAQAGVPCCGQGDEPFAVLGGAVVGGEVADDGAAP